MSSTALKAFAGFLVVAAVILAFVAYRFGGGFAPAEQAAEETAPQPGENQVLAVVATSRIPPYQPIPAESVALVPISVEPAQYYTDVNEVVGRSPLRPVPMGSPVTDDSFSAANTLAQAIPAGSQAMSLEISDVIAVGGFVKPGDKVDVLLYIRSSGREVENSQARVLLEDVRVLAYQERLINADPEGEDGDEARQQRRERTAVVAVPEAATTRVMLGASLGELRLSLRGEEVVVDSTTEQADDESTGDVINGDDKPEALAPGSSRVAAKDGSADDDEAAADDDNDKVITLSELAAIERRQTGSGGAQAPRRPAYSVIEVYEGTSSKRITKPIR